MRMREPSSTSSPPTKEATIGTRELPEKEAIVLATELMSSTSVGASSARTMWTLGSSTTVRMATSYLAASASPITSTGL